MSVLCTEGLRLWYLMLPYYCSSKFGFVLDRDEFLDWVCTPMPHTVASGAAALIPEIEAHKEFLQPHLNVEIAERDNVLPDIDNGPSDASTSLEELIRQSSCCEIGDKTFACHPQEVSDTDGR